jgi:hypothetical protein
MTGFGQKPSDGAVAVGAFWRISTSPLRIQEVLRTFARHE